MNVKELTPKLVDDICRLIEEGNYIDAAAVVNDVSPNLAKQWYDRGRIEQERRDDGEFPSQIEEQCLEFFQRVIKAQMAAEVALVSCMRREAEAGSSHATGWLLERTRTERFGRKTKPALGEKDNPIHANVSVVDLVKNGAKAKEN